MKLSERRKKFGLGLKKISLKEGSSDDSSGPQEAVTTNATRFNEKKIYQITSNLFMSGYYSACDINLLNANGINHVVNLTAHKNKNLHEDKIGYSSFSLADNSNFDLTSVLEEILSEIAKLLAKGKKILIHCKMGISRAPSIILAFMIRIQGMTYKEAFSKLQNINPKISPNFGFLLQLQKL